MITVKRDRGSRKVKVSPKELVKSLTTDYNNYYAVCRTCQEYFLINELVVIQGAKGYATLIHEKCAKVVRVD